MAKKKVATPVVVQGYTVAEAMENMIKNQEAEQAHFDALSDEEKVEYLKKREEDLKETEKLIKELSKYSGFSVFGVRINGTKE